jgi:hypothetical protein
MSYKQIRQTLSKKDCNCPTCKKEIKKNTACIIDPKKKEAYHIACYNKSKK